MNDRCDKCEPCACRQMAARPHCMYCMEDLSPEMEAEWRRGVMLAGKPDPCPDRPMTEAKGGAV